MDIKFSFKQLEHTDAVTEVAHRKSERLNKYFHGKLTVQWIFTVEKTSHIAHCHVVGDHMVFFAEGQTDSMYSAIDEAIARIERQLRKNKEVVTNHKVASGF